MRMASDEKMDEGRVLAAEILALSRKDVSRMFYTEMKRRQLGRIVRLLDRMVAQGGEDRRLASTALERLGFPVDQR
jgi:nitrogen-specific signal transduction histidine kinase